MADMKGPSRDRLVFLFADDPVEIKRHSMVLRSFGYDLRVSKNAGSVSGGALSFRPAAIIINNSQPEAVAESLAGVARLSSSGRLTCPIIFIGDPMDLRQRVEARRAGCSSFLTRPVPPMALVDCLDEVLRSDPAEPFRVLIVDDSKVTAMFQAKALQDAGMEVEIVTNPMKVAEPMRRFGPELMLVDLNMPECSGQELAAVIRQERAFESIPILFLSAEDDLQVQLDALRQGGDDFLTKPIAPETLVSAVTIRAERFRNLRSLIIRDSLTGLYNHSATMDRLAYELEQARLQNRDVSSAIIDIDHFKRINDSFGHPIGDYVIKSMARFLDERLDGIGTVGRIGGEEFSVTLPGVGERDAHALLDELRAHFSEIRFATEDEVFQATFSSGVGDNNSFDSLSSLHKAADEALYRAKTGGRNQVICAAAG